MIKSTQTILIVDLSDGDGGDYEKLLQQDSEVRYRCCITSSETQILALSQSHQFDVIILESHESDRSSFTIIEWLKAQMGENCPPIIVVDRNDANLATRAIKAGAVDYLVREQLSAEILVQSLQEAIALNQNHLSQYGTNQTDIRDQRIMVEELRQSAEQLQRTTEAAQVGTWQWNLKTNEVVWSPLMKKLLGYESVLGQNTHEDWVAILHEEDLRRMEAGLPNWIQGGKEVNFEYRITTPETNETRWIQSFGRVECDAQGEPHIMQGIAIDITERKRTEQALSESKERLQVMIENLPGGAVFVVDRDLRYLLAEGETLGTAGFKPEDLVGKTIFDALEPELAAYYEGSYRKALAGESVVLEHNAHGSWYITRKTPLRSASGEIYAVFAVSYDISEHKKVEEALHESEAEYRLLFNSMEECFCSIEMLYDEHGHPVDHRILEANPAFEKHTGLTNARGRLASELMPGVEQYWNDLYARVIATGESEKIEQHSPAFNRWFDVEVSRVGDESLRRVAVVFRDISDRKRQETNLAFLAEVSQDLARLTNIEETMNVLGEKIGGYFNLSASVFAELSETAEIAVINYSWPLSHVPSFIGTYRMQDFVAPEILQLCLAGEAVVICDVFDDPLVDGEQYAALNIGSFLSIPLIRDGEWRFLLVIYHSEPYEWRDDEIELTHELANRIWTRLERARAEEAVEADLRDTQMLHNLATRLVIEEDIQALYQEIVKTAIALTQADAGSFQILDETTQELVVIATQGINRTMREHFCRFDASSNTSCGIALATGERTFIHFDVPDEDPDGSLRIHKDAGLLCAQSTPLISRSGKPIGMISTHWREDRRLSDRELRFLDLLARQAADIIEQGQAEEDRIQLIHEQAAREKERQKAESLAELDRAKTVFFSNVSHEFRTPLTLLLSPLQDALSDLDLPLPELQRERLELAYRNSLRLLKLVNTLLDFSRVQAGRLQANYEATDLSTYTVELASTFRSVIENGGLELVVNCPPLPLVDVDRQMWEKIVLNLLSNAFKFTFEGTITVSLQAIPEERVELTVRDTGIGIFAEELPQIFERFYQIRGKRGRSSEGSGIGLSLVRELVKLHKGEIEVSSEIDRGTIFSVTIPTVKADSKRDRPEQNETNSLRNLPTPTSTAISANSFVAEAERWLPQEEITLRGVQAPEFDSGDSPLPSEPPTTNSKRERILIVDDNADLQNYLQRLLNRDYQVETANNGLVALNKIRAAVGEDSSNYDLVLADIMMPEMDGFELLRSLRADPNTREIPIILLSARAGEESRVEGLAAGADDYLIKPFSSRELLARVNTHLKLVRMRREATYRQRVMEEIQKLNATLEEKVQERTVQLQEINQELEAFSYSVSHDLQTPLSYISSFAQKLQTKLNSSQIDLISQSYLKIMVEATEQSRTMVQNLLEFSRMSQAPLHLTSVPMDLLVQQVREYLEPQLEGRTLHWQIEPLPEVQGNREMLRLVLQNLLSNAVKYTRDRPKATITIGSSDRERETIFWVRDNGVGFDIKYHDRLFGFFQRLHSQEQFEGTGIGLAQVRRIIHRHGGRIWAEGAVDAGATFYFSLPK